MVAADGMGGLGVAGTRRRPARQDAQVVVAGLEALDHHLAGAPRVRVLAAREDIDGPVTELRPRVHRDVRLGQQAQRGHALGLELGGDDVQQRGHALPRRLGHGLAHMGEVVEQVRRALAKLEDAMLANRGYYQSATSFTQGLILVRSARDGAASSRTRVTSL